ncbi:hypothetical protein EDC94DRAFT_603127 [Helicostylum pulchrum]|uniref:Mitochondrial distribution and morphology protein 34 n=1 Tax=Helicostylum pulchrum TaxID=562976 RepID=A0ABP9YFJ3_9FUNG|nr:hypothetical protein EDC94DRAFT_603127 [Helicostylum pulchrum]
MAFRFNWPEFDSEFYKEARSQLEAALNKGNKPKNIVDHISVKELNMGTTAPDLEILEIGELSTDKFRGIFKLTYCGDAYIVIQTKVQANPMHAKESDLPRHTRPSVLAADQPLVVPMLLRISDLKLRGIVVLVVSKTKGITLVFKNDPLESIIVSSTFDSVTSVRSFLQREIENQLRNLFQEDLPVMIHNLSLRHIQSQQEKQKHEEWIQAQQLRRIQQEQEQQKKKISMAARSVFSDPGFQLNTSFLNQSSSNKFDTFSMPDLTRTPPLYSNNNTPSFLDGLSPLVQSPTCFSSFSDLYFINTNEKYPLFAEDTSCGVPVTAANLSTLNALYSSRFAALKTSPYSEFESDKVPSAAAAAKEEKEEVVSVTAHELYADDENAPWYVREGPELPSTNVYEKALTMMAMDEDIILNPKENSIAAKLAHLASVNHTISPFAHIIQHSTFRSLPHTIKVDSRPKHKKTSKRRIIRWNTTI